MGINAKIVRQGTNYTALRHKDEVAESQPEEHVQEKVKPQVKHAPVVDHIKMRKRLSAHKTSKYAEDLLNT